jgi:hypothetical protein
MVLCRFVHNTLGQHVKALITLHFSSFGQAGLEQRVMKFSSQLFSAQPLTATEMKDPRPRLYETTRQCRSGAHIEAHLSRTRRSTHLE